MAIKKQPGDFIVDEQLTEDWQQKIGRQPGPFALYALRKTSVTTPQAVSEFASRLKVKPGAVSYAGLKDKHGITTQHVTVDLKGLRGSLPGEIAGGNWSARRLGYVGRAIDASAIAANAFRLVIRTLTRRSIDDMNQQIERLTIAADTSRAATPATKPALLSPNYFGNQRFGSVRHGEGFLAKRLIRGEFEEALKRAIAVPDRKDDKRTKAFKRLASENWGNWRTILADPVRVPERPAVEHLAQSAGDFRAAFATLPYFLQQIWVDAYQSWIWNETAARFINEACAARDADRTLLIDDQYNRLPFPPADAVPDDLRGLDLPILGHNSVLRQPWADAAQAVLEGEGITTAELDIPGLRRPQFGEVPRPLFVVARDFHAGNPQPDELQTKARRFKRTISFSLPRGAYATVILRGLGQ